MKIVKDMRNIIVPVFVFNTCKMQENTAVTQESDVQFDPPRISIVLFCVSSLRRYSTGLFRVTSEEVN